ncbi:GNAT family N-acetyltransferase [Pectobacterium parmentieri]|uniref:GNAT family N-acetyltransferase n=1 Tax=Pectobacterium parmentieri TaxID=1905730 RepID=UPI0018DF5AD7|nr:GNAT family N-acetyltransferase [Pectobacterium parmentieri]MBI0549029.1 GNAT family N-acetyltransferase [Pectobacterium parmentieri]MBI0558049.1 GNAT family N-acetyltransferase [Pectobacterium parmentieri]MBI0562102.1 GNAT family N-acetyltransferase [Pectobacterium parmentieri]
MSTFRLSLIDSDRDYLACFNVMRELRPHLPDAATFTTQARRQAGQGYHLMAAWQGDLVMGLVGYRIQENLFYGRFLYVDDLVATADVRHQGLGGLLIEAMREEAQRQGCAHLVLDTALGNALAQRFYFRQGLLSKGLHFSQAL